MALTSWNLATCPLKDLVTGSSWTLSGSGTAEYYYNVGDLSLKPNGVLINGAVPSLGTLGSLAAGEYAWGINDGQTDPTLYVRLSDDTDPDTKASDYVQCSEPLQVFQKQTGTELILLSLFISNYSYTHDANIWFFLNTGAGALRMKWPLDIPVDASPFALDSKIVFTNTDKLLVMASIEEVCVFASGDES